MASPHRQFPSSIFFFFNDTATTEIYTLSLHDALPILVPRGLAHGEDVEQGLGPAIGVERLQADQRRSEEHTSELQSPCNLVCRLLLEKKKTSDPSTYRTCCSLTSLHFMPPSLI